MILKPCQQKSPQIKNSHSTMNTNENQIRNGKFVSWLTMRVAKRDSKLIGFHIWLRPVKGTAKSNTSQKKKECNKYE